MTAPTTEQLASSVPPIIREYIDAAISEAIAKAKMGMVSKGKAMDQTMAYVESRLGEIEAFEAQVRINLGIAK